MNDSISDFAVPTRTLARTYSNSLGAGSRCSTRNRPGAGGFRISDSESSSAFSNSQSAIRNTQSKGFTLLEVLLAMAILAIISTVIYGTFTATARNVEQAEESRDDTDLARTLITRLSDDISNAFCSTNVKGSFFYGKDNETEIENAKVRHDTVSLTTLTNWRKPDSKENELWEVGYFFKEKEDGKGYVLYRREKRELNVDSPPLEGGNEYEITDRIQHMQLRYYDGTKLVDSWDRKAGCSPSNLPIAVEISLMLDSGKVYTTEILRERLSGS